MKLETDGIQYDILERAVRAAKDVPGLFLEIGTRRGGSLQIIIDAAIGSVQSRHVVSVDPYGDIPYDDGRNVTRYDYTNEMKKAALSDLYKYVHGKPINLITFTLADEDFFHYFAAGVPIYDHERRLIAEYAFAFLDGPHSTQAVTNELMWLSPRMPAGGQVVIDNIDFFDLQYVLVAGETLNFFEEERNAQKIRLCKR